TSAQGNLDSPLIFIPQFSEIIVRSKPQPRMSEIPVVSIGSLLNRELGPWTNSWVHLNGLVAAYQPGRSIVVKDPTGVLRARVVQLTEVHGDARVDVWGFLDVSGEETVLNGGYFEVVRPMADTAPSAAASSRQDGRSPSVLTQFDEILKLNRDEAALQLPVQLHGII